MNREMQLDELLVKLKETEKTLEDFKLTYTFAADRILSLREDLELVEAKLKTTESKLSIAWEALDFYGDFRNYSIDHDTSQNGFSRRCILYSDIEERNEATGLAGKKAREAIRKIGEVK